MNAKLDHLFRFRDNEKFKVFVKYYTYVVLTYIVVCFGFIFSRFFVETINNHSSEMVSSVLNFISVPLILLLSFFRKNDYLFILAEFFTIFADMCMMLKLNRPVGFAFFLIVQLIFALYFYIRDANKRRKLIIMIIRPILMALTMLIIYLVPKLKFNPITVLGALYLENLFINLACAIIAKDKILIIGFAVYALSDTLIATRQFIKSTTNYWKITDKINHLPYLVSQVVLAFNKFNNDYVRNIK